MSILRRLCCVLIVLQCSLIADQSMVSAQGKDQKLGGSVSTTGVARIHERDFTRQPPPTKSNSQDKQTAPQDSKTDRQLSPEKSLPAKEDKAKTSLSTDGKPAEPEAKPEPFVLPEIISADQGGEITTPGLDDEGLDDEDTEDGSSKSIWSFQNMTDRKALPATIQMFVSIAAISLVPALLLMTTCFIRIVVVLGILRQAIGLQQLPPTQVTTALALMMTFLIMAPTWKQVKQDAIDPYSAEGSTMSWDEAWSAGITPIKKFMWSQISRAENEKDFWVFYDYLPEEERSQEPESYQDVPLKVLLPAFMISELKVAFLIGIQVLLPFLILDIVVASLCNTMGLIMLPPTVVSLPLKLLLFVMVDGWNLVVTMLLDSFAAF